ncbi:hypothetical protein Q8A67_017826 [Cirrhinus molitorella]|uniref:Uncharacterized protein n=1 Tax=Cirrhinus molitorella TaxID=172907 RepID=A0AA88PQT9_9TELE|nr:hypothetical protein Q8A67_017826 [Cirrhinus molitorella]
MQRGRLVRRGGVQLQDTSAKHCVVILPPRHTVLSHQSESRWLSELWRFCGRRETTREQREVESGEVVHKGMRGGRSDHLMVSTHA